MATPRAQLVDPEHALCYHLISRCVRRAFLCGRDPLTRTDYSHRKAWLEQRMIHLSQCFAVDLYAHAIMSNHFHLVVYFDPKACLRWSDDEVAERWIRAFPPRCADADAAWQHEACKQALINTPHRLARCRERLGSLSAFMQHLKQPIARWANREDNTSGHFFEQRFHSGALLSEAALLAAMAYVDLNPVRAKIAERIEQCRHTSIAKRLEVLENNPERLEQALSPLNAVGDETEDVSTRNHNPLLTCTLREYIGLLRELIESYSSTSAVGDDRQARWVRQVATLAWRQRAYGSREMLDEWIAERNMRRLERPFL